jgi:hypothetical protein
MALNERIVPILSLHQPQVLRLSRRTPLQGSRWVDINLIDRGGDRSQRSAADG